MYAVRGIVISLGVFSLIYLTVSAIVICCWRAVPGKRWLSLSSGALYAIRTLPLLSAIAVVILLTIPSFLYLEPIAADEKIGGGPIVLAVGGAALLTMGFVNVVVSLWRTFRFVTFSLANSERCPTDLGVSVFQTSDFVPALIVGGVFRPILLVSRHAVELLDADEMQAAIRHEMAHVRRRDNLKKLFLRFCVFPSLAPFERAWLHKVETAADEAAVRNEREALDLASALIKIGRARPLRPLPQKVVSLNLDTGTPISVRVERLLSWQPLPAHEKRGWLLPTAIGALIVFLLAFHYTWVLAHMHDFTEFLVR